MYFLLIQVQLFYSLIVKNEILKPNPNIWSTFRKKSLFYAPYHILYVDKYKYINLTLHIMYS